MRTRWREDAQLAEQARAHPERFVELVRQHSEDIVRRDRGGSLGGFPSAQLMPWPELLDALSQPVEPWYAFQPAHVPQAVRQRPQSEAWAARAMCYAAMQSPASGRGRGGLVAGSRSQGRPGPQQGQ